MNFNKYLSIKSILAYSTLNYLQAGFSFAIALLLARKLGAEQYGYYTYGIVFNTTFFILIQYGLDKTLVRDLVQKSEEAATILISGTLLKLIITLLGVLLMVIWGFVFGGDELKKVYIALLFGVSGSIYGIGPRAWFDFKGKIQNHAVFLFIERLIFFSGTIYLLFRGGEQAIILLVGWVLLIGRLIMSFFEWSFVVRTIEKPKWKSVKASLKPLIFQNSWVWLAAINNLIMTNANQLILDQQLGTKQLGYYGLAFQLIMLVQLMQGQVLRLTTPSIAEAVQKTKGWGILNKYRLDLLRCVGLTIAMLIPIYFLAPYLIEWLVGKDYAGALPVLRVLCFWSLVYGLALINNQYLLSYHLQKSFFSITLVFGLISIYLVYAFIPLYGVVGAALSLLTAHFGSVFVQSLMVLRKMHKNAKSTKQNQNRLLPKKTAVNATETIR